MTNVVTKTDTCKFCGGGSDCGPEIRCSACTNSIYVIEEQHHDGHSMWSSNVCVCFFEASARDVCDYLNDKTSRRSVYYVWYEEPVIGSVHGLIEAARQGVLEVEAEIPSNEEEQEEIHEN